MGQKVLIVDDEDILRINICEFMERAGFSVSQANHGAEALEKIQSEDFPVVVTDLKMPVMDGLQLLEKINQIRPETLVLIMTAYASVDSAIQALRLGAHDYILKPITPEDLIKKVENLISFRELKDELSRLRRSIQTRLGYQGIVGESEAMQQVYDQINKLAHTNTTVLIRGECGTGKELVARAVHESSQQAKKEFLPVNMASGPLELLESQLFGHQKGSFTGAHKDRKGVFRSVRGGTVFLDEIGDLALPAQAKILRTIEYHEVLPLGAERPEKVSFRLITATNHKLEELVEKKLFRQDLFYRLNVFCIEIPPLRDRPEDIPLLVIHFNKLHSTNLGRKPNAVSNETMKLLLEYNWPGNIRELSNVIERATILADGKTVIPDHLPREFSHPLEHPTPLRQAVEAFEKKHIQWVLKVSGNHKEQAANLLQIDPATLYRRIAKLKIS